MATATRSSATWTCVTVELPASTNYAAAHGLPEPTGRLILQGDITNRELVAPIAVALTPRDGERLLAIVINGFGDRMNRERVLGPIIVEAGSDEMRAVSDIALALVEASTLSAEEIVLVRARSVDTEMVANAVVTSKIPLLKFDNRTYRGTVGSVLSPAFAAAFISPSHASIEILGSTQAIWPILLSVPEIALPS